MKLSINVYILFYPWRDVKQQSLSFLLYVSPLPTYRRATNRSWLAALNHPFLITISNGPRLTRINYLRWQYSASGANRGAATKRLLER